MAWGGGKGHCVCETKTGSQLSEGLVLITKLNCNPALRFQFHYRVTWKFEAGTKEQQLSATFPIDKKTAFIYRGEEAEGPKFLAKPENENRKARQKRFKSRVKMEAARSSERLLSYHIITRCHNPDDDDDLRIRLCAYPTKTRTSTVRSWRLIA